MMVMMILEVALTEALIYVVIVVLGGHAGIARAVAAPLAVAVDVVVVVAVDVAGGGRGVPVVLHADGVGVVADAGGVVLFQGLAVLIGVFGLVGPGIPNKLPRHGVVVLGRRLSDHVVRGGPAQDPLHHGQVLPIVVSLKQSVALKK